MSILTPTAALMTSGKMADTNFRGRNVSRPNKITGQMVLNSGIYAANVDKWI